MNSHRSHLVPLLVFLLGGCSANAPSPAAATSVKARGTAAGLTAGTDIRQSVGVLSSRAQENLDVSDGPVPGSRLLRIRQG